MEYSVIYADPPWDHAAPHIGNRDIDSWWNAGHVLTQAQLESATLPVSKRAILFLWVPPVILPRGISLLQAWGFKYDGEIVWIKMTKADVPGYGMGGHLVKYTHECLLVGLRGGVYANVGVIRSAIMSARLGGYGTKPEITYDLIEETAKKQHLDPPFLELFARQAREGWHTVGNTIESQVVIPEWVDER